MKATRRIWTGMSIAVGALAALLTHSGKPAQAGTCEYCYQLDCRHQESGEAQYCHDFWDGCASWRVGGQCGISS